MIRLLLRLGAIIVVALSIVFIGQRLLAPTDGATTVAIDTTPVRVASVALPVGTFVDEVEASFVDWPDTEIQDGWITAGTPDDRDVIGAVVIRTIAAGEPIDRADLLLPGQDGFLAAVLRPGKRAVSVAVDAVSGNAGHVFPGDRVDVILTQKLDAAGTRGADWVSETILEAVRVIAVDQDLQEDLTAREAARVPRTFTLEVTPGDAERIAVAGQLGRLSFSLRSFVAEDQLPAADDRAAITFASDVSRARIEPAADTTPSVDTSETRAPQIRVMRGRTDSTTTPAAR